MRAMGYNLLKGDELDMAFSLILGRNDLRGFCLFIILLFML
jgi:hypothetical protein